MLADNKFKVIQRFQILNYDFIADVPSTVITPSVHFFHTNKLIKLLK